MKTNIPILTLSILLIGCSPNQTPIPKVQPLNITLVLDMSDRIKQDLNPGQARMDLTLIESVLDRFEKRVAFQGYIGAKDRLSIAFCYAGRKRGTALDINGQLVLDVGSLPIAERKDSLKSELNKHWTFIKELYDDISQSSLDGSANLFSYFKDDYDEVDGFDNRVMLVTDGYLYFKEFNRVGNRATGYQTMKELRNEPNWKLKFDEEDYGFLSVEKKFRHSKILVLGIEPRPGLNEFAILSAYWTKWLHDEMGMSSVVLVKNNMMPGLNSRLLKDIFQP